MECRTPPWVWPLTALLFCTMFFVAVYATYRSGFEAGVQQERALKAEHDKFMRDLGTCDWAKIKSKNIQCQRQLP